MAAASIESTRVAQFDALVLPHGIEPVDLSPPIGKPMEFVNDQDRHCKSIVVPGLTSVNSDEAGIEAISLNGSEDPGLLIGDIVVLGECIRAIDVYRHPGRDMDLRCV